jgi:hypothetical protein
VEKLVYGGFVTENFGKSPTTQEDPEHSTDRRDPEDRRVDNPQELKDKMLDKTLADSFPTSDPPSINPNPGDTSPGTSAIDVLAGMPPGIWAAISIDTLQVVGTGASRDEAEAIAKRNGHGKLVLVQTPADPDTATAA